ncbi:unnamed protein product, partial [Oikopleura dioica]
FLDEPIHYFNKCLSIRFQYNFNKISEKLWLVKSWKQRQVGKRPENCGDLAPRKTYCQNNKLGSSQFWLRKRPNYRRSSTMKVNSQKIFSCRKPSYTTANIFKMLNAEFCVLFSSLLA